MSMPRMDEYDRRNLAWLIRRLWTARNWLLAAGSVLALAGLALGAKPVILAGAGSLTLGLLVALFARLVRGNEDLDDLLRGGRGGRS